MAEPNTAGPWAKLRFSDGSSYQLTGDDVLWTARAVVYEGGPPAATLWTLAQRFSKARKNYPSFTAFVQAFSQPINPAWSRTGRFCRPGGHHEGGPYCTEAKLQRREQAAASDFYDLEARDPDALEATLDWARGRLPNPVPRAANFADAAVSRAYLARTPGAKVLLQAGNWYIQEPWSSRWTPNHVTVEGSDGAVASADGVRLPDAPPTGAGGDVFVVFLRTMFRAAARPWRVRV